MRRPASVTSADVKSKKELVPGTTAGGRQRNRRVEMVVSGEVIGTQIAWRALKSVSEGS